MGEILFFRGVNPPTYVMATFSDVILLGSAHVSFTFIQIFSIPEFREWTRERAEKYGYHIRWEMILVFFLAFAISIFLLNPSESHPYQNTLLKILWIFIPLQHALNQQLGISLSYNALIRKQTLPSEPEVKTMIVREKQEKVAFFFLIFFSGLNVIFGANLLIIKDHILMYIRYCLYFMQLVTILYILTLAYRTPGAYKTTKFLFLARLLSLPWGFVSVISLWAGAFMHGIEYTFIAQKVHLNSKRNKWGSRFWMALYLSAIALVALNITHPTVIQSFYPLKGYPIALQILSSTALALTWTHFYLDRQLYRMRDPISKKWVAPLIFKAPH